MKANEIKDLQALLNAEQYSNSVLRKNWLEAESKAVKEFAKLLLDECEQQGGVVYDIDIKRIAKKCYKVKV